VNSFKKRHSKNESEALAGLGSSRY